MSAPFRILNECASTNDEAKRWAAEGVPHGAWVLARRQTQGRGRLGREWLSGDGNLFLSIILRVEAFVHLTWLPLLVAAATVEALQFEDPNVPFRLKWPNDIWLGNGKLGGVLCESSNGVVVAGIGLNLNEAPLGELMYPAATLREYTGRQYRPDVIAARIAWVLLQKLQTLLDHGPGELRRFYDQHALFSAGTSVEWNGHRGEVLGLGEMSELRVRSMGRVVSLFAEDVRVSSAVG